MKKSIIALLVLSLLIFAGCTGQAAGNEKDYSELAQCLTDKGAKFYGTYWCKFCKKQKDLFGDAIQYVDYIECDPAAENGDPEACIEAGIDRYPSWFFPGQGIEVGFHEAEDLAKKVNCEEALPAEPDEST